MRSRTEETGATRGEGRRVDNNAVRLEVQVVGRVDLAVDVLGLGLRRTDGEDFPVTHAGAHLRLHLASGLERNYSLVGVPGRHQRLDIAVQLAADSRGGSKEVFGLHEGDTLHVGLPPNSFELADDEEDYLLLAGGIGITPIWSMIQHLEATERSWRLHYAAGSEARAAFLNELCALEAARPRRVHLAFSDAGDRLDLAALSASAGPRTGVYCCGPHRFVSAFRDAAGDLAERAHVEDFTPAEVAAGGFDVELATSGLTLFVPDGSSILDVVLEAGLEPDYSCMSGTCGSCETTVLSGVPEHRDLVLGEQEREANTSMMICCSGCRSGPLVLDL
ncbi:PDR/VanB family oxidoreductase [Streptomyces malaysiensis]|uniref:PDR/VanB family oxidoreductase n=1 Tax=Streptomyces malaysiensis TaxID=92644 RepID=UPI002B28E33D|nr:PDR/VanB family oxidoreductase [Streptomyces malaysiensis]